MQRSLSLLLLNAMLLCRVFGEGEVLETKINNGVDGAVTQSVECLDAEYFISNFNKIYDKQPLAVKEKLLREAISLWSAEDADHLSAAKCYKLLGDTYRKDNQYDNASEYYEKARIDADEKLDIEVLNGLGVVHRRLDRLRSAMACHLEALKKIEVYKGNYGEVSFQHRVSLNSIGNIFITLKQYYKALDYFSHSLSLEQEVENHLGMAINYNNMGYCYQHLGKEEEAEKYYTLSLKENQIVASHLGQSISHNSLGELYFQQGKLQKAMLEFEAAAEFSALLHNDFYHQSITHTNLAQALLHLDDLEAALPHISTLKTMAETTGSRSIWESFLSANACYFEKKEQFDSAFVYYRKARIYNDSIVNESNSSHVNNLLGFYESGKKEQQIDLLTAENQIRQQRMMLFIILSIVLVLTVIVGVLDFIRRRKRNAEEQQMLNQQLLRMQMNPHFLFNALGSIQNYMYRNETQKAAAYLNNFASLTRSILEHTTREFISLDDEIETLRNYLELEQMRSNKGFEYHIVISDELDLDFTEIPPMLIQPFVENAVKHGLCGLNHPGILSIDFKEENQMLYVGITDNGHGISNMQKHSKTHRSMSMQILRKRQKILSRQLKKDVFVSVKNRAEQNPKESGTRVEVRISLEG